MTSTPKERLFEIYQAYSSAYKRRPDDLKEAQTAQQASAVLKNVEELESAYLKAAKQALDASGEAVEAAYQAARQARQDVEDAYNQAKRLADRIRAVGNVVRAVGNLIVKASG